MGGRHEDARGGDHAHELEGIERGATEEWRALDLHQQIDRHGLRVRRQVGELTQHGGAVAARLAHAEDAAATGLESDRAHMCSRVSSRSW